MKKRLAIARKNDETLTADIERIKNLNRGEIAEWDETDRHTNDSGVVSTLIEYRMVRQNAKLKVPGMVIQGGTKCAPRKAAFTI